MKYVLREFESKIFIKKIKNKSEFLLNGVNFKKNPDYFVI